LKLSRGDPSVEENPFGAIIGLSTSDHELVVFNGDRQIGFRKSRHCERYAVGAFSQLFDIIGGISFIAGFHSPLNKAVQFLKSQQKRMRREGNAGHQPVLSKATYG
jgi:hypothetical protein